MKEETDLLGKLDELIKHLEQPGAVVPKDQCYAIIQEVNKQWDTADTEPKRVALLHILDSTYNVLQTTMFGEDVNGFAEHRDKLYKALLLSEVMIGKGEKGSGVFVVNDCKVAGSEANHRISWTSHGVLAGRTECRRDWSAASGCGGASRNKQRLPTPFQDPPEDATPSSLAALISLLERGRLIAVPLHLRKMVTFAAERDGARGCEVQVVVNDDWSLRRVSENGD